MLFSSYTDVALLMGSPIVAFVISILLAALGFPDTAAKVIGWIFVTGAAGIALVHTARTNHSFWMTASSFVAKYTLLAIGGLIAIVVYVLLAPGGRKKYERHASYERRSSAQTAAAMAAGLGAAAYLGHLLCERQEFVHWKITWQGQLPKQWLLTKLRPSPRHNPRRSGAHDKTPEIFPRWKHTRALCKAFSASWRAAV